MQDSYKTVAVTVTYGNRIGFVTQVVHGALAAGVATVVVVDNGSEASVGKALSDLRKTLGERLVVVSKSANTGSAAGFKAGIEAAATVDFCSFIWLLDDDNVPASDALHRLYDAYRYLGEKPDNALLSFRRNQEQCIEAVTRGTSAAIPPNSFQGFHWRLLWRRFMTRLRGKRPFRDTHFRFPLVRLDMAVYGGLWFHKSLIERIGLPDERYFVYCDDFDFTSRVIAQQAAIYLCANSEVIDVDQPWSHQAVRSSPWMSQRSSESRVYFSMRNQVYFEHRYVTRRLEYKLNRWLYLSIVLLLGFLGERDWKHVRRRFRLLRRALRDGDAGRLGPDLPAGYGR